MAVKTLRLTFENSDNPGKKININIANADDTKGSAVPALVSTIVTNKHVFNMDIGTPLSAGYITPQNISEVPIV